MPSFRSHILKSLIDDIVSEENQKHTLQENRVLIDQRARRLVRAVKGVKVDKIEVEGIPAHWHSLQEPVQNMVLYLHGGSYTICSPATHKGLASRIALAGRANLLLPAYRLAPEHPFPAALEDAIICYRWLMAQDHKSEDLIIAGDSAGGGLTLAVALKLKEIGLPLPSKLVLLSPWVDLAAAPKMGLLYAKESELKNPLVSPLYGNLAGLPPTLIQVGGADMIRADSLKLEQRMKAAGVSVELQEYEGMFHVFQAFAPLLPEAQPAIEKIGIFIKN